MVLAWLFKPWGLGKRATLFHRAFFEVPVQEKQVFERSFLIPPLLLAIQHGSVDYTCISIYLCGSSRSGFPIYRVLLSIIPTCSFSHLQTRKDTTPSPVPMSGYSCHSLFTRRSHRKLRTILKCCVFCLSQLYCVLRKLPQVGEVIAAPIDR